jgi:uncharacterized Zn finger protein
MPNNLSEAKWKADTCTCPYFLKKYMCKHIIGLAIRLKAASHHLQQKKFQEARKENEEDQINQAKL